MSKCLLTPPDIATIKELYPYQSTRSIAERLGLSERTVYNWAYNLGLKKSPEYMKNTLSRLARNLQESLQKGGCSGQQRKEDGCEPVCQVFANDVQGAAQVIVLANNKLDSVSTVNPSIIQQLRDTVLQQIEAVKHNPEAVGQAKQVFQGVNTLINLAKTELEYRKFITNTDI